MDLIELYSNHRAITYRGGFVNENQHLGSERPPLRHTNSSRSRQRRRTGSPQLHGRGLQTPSQRRRNASGYQLQRHPINFAGRRGRINAVDPHFIVLAAAILIVIVLIIFWVVSCSHPQEAAPEAPQVSEQMPNDLKTGYSQALARARQIEELAQHPENYPESLLSLALTEPGAVSFVYNWPTAGKDADSQEPAAYTGDLTAGTVPELFDWDLQWGYRSYGNGYMATAGSGPVAASMAIMALTGSPDLSPAAIAKLATDASKATGDSGTDPSFFTEKSSDLGVAVTPLDIASATSGESSQSSDSSSAQSGTQGASQAGNQVSVLADALKDNAYVVAQTSGGALGAGAHWVLLAPGDDGALKVYDPASTANSGHQWDPATVASDLSSAFRFSAAANS